MVTGGGPYFLKVNGTLKSKGKYRLRIKAASAASNVGGYGPLSITA